MNTGYGQVTSFLNYGRNANKNIGGITIVLAGLINSSSTGAIFVTNWLNI